MSAVDTLTPEEYAQQLRNPTGPAGLAVVDRLSQLNREGNLIAIANLKVTPNSNVLEVGCGTGDMAKIVTEQAENVTYVGVDISPTMIETAIHRNSDLIEKSLVSFYEVPAAKMPLEDARFSHVFSIGVIHFWSDPIGAFTEVRRVMRPGGQMLMGCLAPENAPPFARMEYGFHLHDAQTWRSFCSSAGFSTVEAFTRSLNPVAGPHFIHLAAQA